MSDSVNTNGPTANEVMQQEWEAFTKHRDTLQHELHQRREALAKFSVNENIMRIRTERSSVIEEIRRYQRPLQDIQQQVRRAAKVVERRQEAAAKPQIITDIRKRIAWARNLLERLELFPRMGKKIKEGKQLLAADEQLLEDYRGSLPEAEAELQRLREEEQQCVQALHERQDKADALKEEIRALEREVQDAVQIVQSQLQEHHTTILQWAVQNRAELTWFIQQQPDRRSEAIALFRKLNPQEDVSDLVPKTSPSSPPSQPKSRKRPKVAKAEGGTEQTPETPNVSTVVRPWVFILITTTQTREYRLPPIASDQQRVLRKLLKKMKCSAKPSLVLSALARVVNVTPQQRTSFDRVMYAEPQGWLIIHAGEFRILCDVNDQERVIRFCVRTRRDAYA